MANEGRSSYIPTGRESTTPGADGVEESEEALDTELGTDRELYLNKLAEYVYEIETILQEADITWDIRPVGYSEELEIEEPEVSDIIDINKLLSHMLFFWEIKLKQTGSNAYAITLDPKKAQVRGLMSGGTTPEEAVINVIWRYLKEIGTERMKN